MKEEKSRLDKYAPMGINIAKEVMLYIMLMTISVFNSLLFIGRYLSERGALYEWVAGKRVLNEEAKIPAFSKLIEGCFVCFGIAIVVMVAILFYHYIYHYQESKSIYLMRRLTNKWELHRRCMAMPIGAIVVAIVIMIILYFVYQGIYLFFTPQQCLPF